MRILSLTAGAAGMYCGTCMRDNALARELIAQGHDVLLAPIYTPTLTDDVNVSHERIFFGGISVYLQQYSSLFRKLPAWLDRIWDSKWMLKMASTNSIPVDPKLLGELTVSMLRGERGFQRKEVQKMAGWLKEQPQFDVIDLPYSLLISLAEPLKRELRAPVCCTLQGEDLFLNGLQEPWRSECLDLIRAQIQHADTFIAVSAYYADFMSGYLSIPREKIQVVPLGISFQGHEAIPKTSEGRLTVGYFARVAPEKGLHILCEAIALMKEPVELRAAGFLPAEHRGYLADLQKRFGFTYEGAPDREGKIHFLRSVDVLSVPSVYDEPKGIFLFEAMANGTPVVQPRKGAYPEIVTNTGGGILVEADNPGSLAEALDELAGDRARLRSLEAAAATGVREVYSVDRMARRTLEVYNSVVRQPAGAGTR
ncbi:MAG TPA: glycosyltransferase family 4 protein, partial [Bryobacteraceae bacterium]|nr:glycosyltransferase family 4 protein [Bryobacteraceae bacterium]